MYTHAQAALMLPKGLLDSSGPFSFLNSRTIEHSEISLFITKVSYHWSEDQNWIRQIKNM